MKKAVTAILLAAGKGCRMVSHRQKVMHGLCGRPVLDWVMRSVQKCIVERPVTVLGFDGDSVKDYFGMNTAYVYQDRLGSEADALTAGMSAVNASEGYVLAIAGNLPLISEATVAALVDAASGADASRLICLSEESETRISAAYCFEVNALRSCMACEADSIENYIRRLRGVGASVIDVYAADIEGIPVETREDLWRCSSILRQGINYGHMKAGVTFIDPGSAYIDADVKIGMDTVIYPDVYLSGNTEIGWGCVIYNGCRLDNTVVGDGCVMQAVVATDARVDDGSRVGPFVRLRPNAHIGAGCKIGNFVEVKNSSLGEKTSVAHLTYVGDADVGAHVNMGCGTVFANYDGVEKHRSTVGDNAFLGCNTALVSPVRIGRGAFTAAGSVITQDVPDGALAIARARQANKQGWVKKYRAIKAER